MSFSMRARIAAVSIRAPRIVVTNGMFNSTASRRIMFPSRTAPPDTVGTLTMKEMSPRRIKSNASGCFLSLIL